MHPLCRCNFLFRLDILDLVWAYPLRTFTFTSNRQIEPLHVLDSHLDRNDKYLRVAKKLEAFKYVVPSFVFVLLRKSTDWMLEATLNKICYA